ncbi:hypothetical protein PanWU01x14_001510 [Parasponia andersonii]|uniref:Uncharacterized protein n=1 Tax=Parasponia andersonii TaxID=3476 RepID=A0A2P5E4W2_PARAD|nr:hypothetical protein PanWU01x14_001510 [Parasponia andersonii]
MDSSQEESEKDATPATENEEEGDSESDDTPVTTVKTKVIARKKSVALKPKRKSPVVMPSAKTFPCVL